MKNWLIDMAAHVAYFAINTAIVLGVCWFLPDIRGMYVLAFWFFQITVLARWAMASEQPK